MVSRRGDNFRTGRAPFDLRGDDRDYSGTAISDRYLAGSDASRSFFNGVNLTNCVFHEVRLDHSEFAEARAEHCEFRGCDLSGSDLVDSLFSDVLFVACRFETAEWRDATFQHCRFIDCNFSHATIALCAFTRCSFDAASMRQLEHRAVSFNVFSECDFPGQTHDRLVASRNFGIPAAAEVSELVSKETSITIEHICLMNNRGHLRVAAVADAAEALCTALSSGRQRRNSTLMFLAKIVRVLTQERRISATSLIYLEEVISHFASLVDDQDTFISAMAAVIEIRTALFSISTEAVRTGDATTFRSVRLRFSRTYARDQAEALRDAIAEAAGVPSAELEIETFRQGSTFIELIATAGVSASAFLLSLNLILRQATVTVERLNELRGAIKTLRRGTTSRRSSKASAGRKLTKVQSIIATPAVAAILIPVRNAVRRSGRTLVELDEPATVSMSPKKPNRRR